MTSMMTLESLAYFADEATSRTVASSDPESAPATVHLRSSTKKHSESSRVLFVIMLFRCAASGCVLSDSLRHLVPLFFVDDRATVV